MYENDFRLVCFLYLSLIRCESISSLRSRYVHLIIVTFPNVLSEPYHCESTVTIIEIRALTSRRTSTVDSFKSQQEKIRDEFRSIFRTAGTVESTRSNVRHLQREQIQYCRSKFYAHENAIRRARLSLLSSEILWRGLPVFIKRIVPGSIPVVPFIPEA
jgi:hypothetical protein